MKAFATTMILFLFLAGCADCYNDEVTTTTFENPTAQDISILACQHEAFMNLNIKALVIPAGKTADADTKIASQPQPC
jgi:hypothetical protein